MAPKKSKLIQICASQNDLFGLDEEGKVFQYNFNMSSWMHLGRGRSADGAPRTHPPLSGVQGAGR